MQRRGAALVGGVHIGSEAEKSFEMVEGGEVVRVPGSAADSSKDAFRCGVQGRLSLFVSCFDVGAGCRQGP